VKVSGFSVKKHIVHIVIVSLPSGGEVRR